MFGLNGASKRLERYISAAEDKPWAPGVVDCCMFVSDWVELITGLDAGRFYRGIYSCDDGISKITTEMNGLVRIFETCAADMGLHETFNPVVGDVGVIGSELNIQRQFGAIYDGSKWIVRYKNGIGRMSANTLKSWSFEQCRAL